MLVEHSPGIEILQLEENKLNNESIINMVQKLRDLKILSLGKMDTIHINFTKFLFQNMF